MALVLPASIVNLFLAKGLRPTDPSDAPAQHELFDVVGRALQCHLPGREDISPPSLRAVARTTMAGGGGYERYAPFVPGVNTRKAFTRYRNQTLTQPNSYGDLAVLLAILDAHGLTATVWVMPRPNAQSPAMTLVPVPGGTGFYDSPCTSSVSKTATALGAAARSLSRTPHPPPPSPSWRRGSLFEHSMACVWGWSHTTSQLGN